MRILLLLMIVMTEVFAAWTASYHVILLGQLPAWTTTVPFLILLPLLLAWSRRDWSKVVHGPRREWGFATGVLILGGILGFAALGIANYNPDDYNFFHRALVQASRLDQPFALTETGHLPAGLPQLSLLHAMTSYEPAVALIARLLGADPLGCYQNGGELLGVVLLTVVLALLYRQFRLGPRMAFAATVFAVLYMATDVRLPCSYGNILLYCWTGKVLLWGVLLPWTIVLVLRFLRHPCLSRWVLVLLAGVCAPGLSGSGVFLFPVEVTCVSVAYLLQGRLGWKRLRRAALVNTGSFYCLVIAALGILGVIPRPSNCDVWIQEFPGDWLQNLGLIFSGREVVLRDALLVLIVPLFALPRLPARLAVLLAAAVLLIVANPLAGPLWMRIVTPGAYWRFTFLLPLAWYAGLVVPALVRGHRTRLCMIGSRTIAVAAIAAALVAWHLSLYWPTRIRSELHVKSPWALRLPQREAEFARLAIPHLRGRFILGPQNVCICIALLDPQLKFYAIRGTQHIFANAGFPAEGRRRVAAQSAVTQGKVEEGRSAELAATLKESLNHGVDAVILVDSEPVRHRVMPQLAASAAGRWRLTVAGGGYALFLRSKK